MGWICHLEVWFSRVFSASPAASVTIQATHKNLPFKLPDVRIDLYHLEARVSILYANPHVATPPPARLRWVYNIP